MQYRFAFPTLFFLLAGAEPALANAWRMVGEEDGMRLETRSVPGQSFPEFRLYARSEASVETLCDVTWGNGRLEADEPQMKHREVIEERPNMRIAYEQVRVPVVADRDYVVKRTKTSDSHGACAVYFENISDKGPKPQKGYVRIPRFYGSWTFEPEGDGSTVTYVIYSEPGGGVPAALAQGPQKQAAKDLMRTILERARRAEPGASVR